MRAFRAGVLAADVGRVRLLYGGRVSAGEPVADHFLSATAGYVGGWRRATFDVPEVDSALAQIVGGKFERDLVPGEDADMMLAHLACRVGDQLMSIVQQDEIAGVGKAFGDDALHFDQFFFGHDAPPVNGKNKTRQVPGFIGGAERRAIPARMSRGVA